MEHDPEDAIALKQVGNSLFKEKKYDEAAEYYSRAIVIQPGCRNTTARTAYSTATGHAATRC